MKSIKTILKLSLNPHYQLTDEELEVLSEYQRIQADKERPHKNNVEVPKQFTKIEKHDTEIKD